MGEDVKATDEGVYVVHRVQVNPGAIPRFARMAVTARMVAAGEKALRDADIFTLDEDAAEDDIRRCIGAIYVAMRSREPGLPHCESCEQPVETVQLHRCDET